MVNAIILAGDSNNSPVSGEPNKALIKIKGRFMVEYVIDALRNAKYIEKIVIVGPKARLDETVGHEVDAVLQGGASMVQNMKKGIDFFIGHGDVLVCTSDIPMVYGEAVDDFISRCVKKRVDVGYPIIDKSLNDIKYPDAKRTYVKMKDGTYTGGNIMYINPEVIQKCYKEAEELVRNRKNAVKMARVFGLSMLIKFSLGILKIGSVEKRVNRLFGLNAAAIKTEYPEIGNDVDKDIDVDFVNKYLNVGV